MEATELLPPGDWGDLEIRPVTLDQSPWAVLHSDLHAGRSRSDLVVLDVRDRAWREDGIKGWVGGWEAALDRAGPSVRARAPRLAVVGDGLGQGLADFLERKGVFVVDRARPGFSGDAETEVRRRLGHIWAGPHQSQLLLLLNWPNPFGAAGGPLVSEADPAYEAMPVPDMAAYDTFLDWLRRGRRSDSD